MIYLTTGANGAGKTLITLKDVREQQLKENRPVYFHGFTAKQQLLDWGWKEFDPKLWQDLPDGSICVMDECQNEFPAKIQGQLPDYINAVAQFRRKRGFDFWMIAPHPKMININIRALIQSPSWHRHMNRTFGADMVSELKFNHAEMNCEKPGAGKNAQVSLRRYPKEVYDWYESASLHTGKKKIPRAVYIVAACALAVPAGLYFAITGVTNNVTKTAKAADPAASTGTGLSAPKTHEQELIKVSAEDWLLLRKPRLPEFPHTAPAYDEVTKPTTAPYPAACVQSNDKCKCYTQQATVMFVSLNTCKQIVENGYFMDWHEQRQQNQMQQPRMQQVAQQGIAAPSQGYQQPQQRGLEPEVLGWEERNQKRNAEVTASSVTSRLRPNYPGR